VDRHDVPDFEKTKPPDYEPPEGAVGPEALRGDDPFIMQADGKGWLFAPNGLLDGPLPTHYEPHESPVRNPLYGQQGNPTRKVYGRAGQPVEPVAAGGAREVFPFVLTAARLTEHHTAGGMSRQLPYLSELQPELFVEVSPELARSAGWTTWAGRTSSPAGPRSRPGCGHRPDGAAAGRRAGRAPGVDALPLGLTGLVTGDVGQRPARVVADPNVLIQESKVATCDVRPGPPPAGAGADREECWRAAPRAGSPPPRPGRRWRPPPDPADPGGDRPRTAMTEQTQLYGRSTLARRRGLRGAPAARRASSPTRRCASAARPARWPARSGTSSRTTASPAGHVVRQHRDARRELVAARRVHRAAAPGGQDAGLAGLPTGPSGSGEMAGVARLRAAARWLRARHQPAAHRARAAAPSRTWACRRSSARGRDRRGDRTDFRWLMASDVCKHCTHAGCLDVCPTGALFRTEFGTVVVQQDICNGCGYCVSRPARTA
jgi:formate dehydrogenase major subunit